MPHGTFRKPVPKQQQSLRKPAHALERILQNHLNPEHHMASLDIKTRKVIPGEGKEASEINVHPTGYWASSGERF